MKFIEKIKNFFKRFERIEQEKNREDFNWNFILHYAKFICTNPDCEKYNTRFDYKHTEISRRSYMFLGKCPYCFKDTLKIAEDQSTITLELYCDNCGKKSNVVCYVGDKMLCPYCYDKTKQRGGNILDER